MFNGLRIKLMHLTCQVVYLQFYQYENKYKKIYCCSRNFVKKCNKGSTELYCLFIAADSIVDAISFIRHIVLWSENKFSPNPALAPIKFEFPNLASSGSGCIWNSQISYNPIGDVVCAADFCNKQLVDAVWNSSTFSQQPYWPLWWRAD